LFEYAERQLKLGLTACKNFYSTPPENVGYCGIPVGKGAAAFRKDLWDRKRVCPLTGAGYWEGFFYISLFCCNKCTETKEC